MAASKKYFLYPCDDNGLPIVGHEYTYLDQPVKVTRVVPCHCGPNLVIDLSTAFFENRWASQGHCDVGALSNHEREPAAK